MDYILNSVLPAFAKYPVILIAMYVLTLFYPRVASYFYSTILGLLVVYGIWHFDDQFEDGIHLWLTSTDFGAWFYSFFEQSRYEDALHRYDRYEDTRDSAEVAFSQGVYFMLKVVAAATLIGVPFAARARVKEAIGNIGRRPAKNPPPVL